MLDSVVRHQQSILDVEVRALAGCLVQYLLQQTPVIRMHSSQEQLDGQRDRRLVFEDSKRFDRPRDPSAANAPVPAASGADALPLGKKGFAALQIGIEAGVLQRYRGL